MVEKNQGSGTTSSFLPFLAGGELQKHQKTQQGVDPFLDLFSVFLLPLGFLLFPSSSGVQHRRCWLLVAVWVVEDRRRSYRGWWRVGARDDETPGAQLKGLTAAAG